MSMTRYILQILCPDQKGLIAGTTQVLAKAGANIIDLQQHTAKDIETFFLRYVFLIRSIVFEYFSAQKKNLCLQ